MFFLLVGAGRMPRRCAATSGRLFRDQLCTGFSCFINALSTEGTNPS